MNNKISVVIPVYNVEKYLSRCLESVLSNTYKNLEVICVNDGSTDNSADILNSFADQDSRITVVHKANAGVSSARNVGLNHITGDFVAFVDSDDWIHPAFFETLIKIQHKHLADIVILDLKSVSEKNEFEDISAQEITVNELSLEQVFKNHTTKSYVTGRLFKKEVLIGFSFPEETKVLEDAIFNTLIMCAKPLKITYTPIGLYYYFSCPTSLMHHINALDFLVVSKLLFKYALEQTNNHSKKIFIIETIKRALFTRYATSVTTKNKQQKKECNNLLKSAVFQLSLLDIVTFKDKVKYYILYKIPQAYRLYRVISDPTLLNWEKEQRKD